MCLKIRMRGRDGKPGVEGGENVSLLVPNFGSWLTLHNKPK